MVKGLSRSSANYSQSRSGRAEASCGSGEERREESLYRIRESILVQVPDHAPETSLSGPKTKDVVKPTLGARFKSSGEERRESVRLYCIREPILVQVPDHAPETSLSGPKTKDVVKPMLGARFKS